MQNIVKERSKIPVKYSALFVSLCVASVLLVIDIYLYYIGYISTEVAMWTATGIFVAAASYESFLLSLVARYMFNRLKNDLKD